MLSCVSTKPPREGGQQRRNIAKFNRPCILGDQFLQYNSNSYATDSYERDLIAKVNAMLANEASDTLALLKLIDQLQRTGLAYHFEEEIGSHLTKLIGSYPELIKDRGCDNDLLFVSLLFRLLRQHGYYASSDVFNKFKDTATGKFRESLAGNVLGILSLFEASYMLVPGEVILEEALTFTSSHLESVEEKRESPFIVKLASHVLKQPIRHGHPRVEALHYIRIYQDDTSCNETLLALAKLDFNSLQKLHQKEVCDVVRWWKDGDFMDNLPFARDRIVECYLWILAVYFEPEFSFARKFLTKVLAIISLMDDMFDAYGTPEELELSTEAIERSGESAVDELPEYMKFFYKELMNIYDENEEEMARRGYTYRLRYAKQLMKDQAKLYLEEVRWLQRKYIPSIDDYIALASKTIAIKMLIANTMVGMGDVITEDAFKWVSSNPPAVKSLATASRFVNDIVGHKFEQERGHVASSIHCLMKQYGCIDQEAEEMLRKRISECWKVINEACLRPLAVPMPVMERIVNWLRSTTVIYGDNVDHYTQCTSGLKDVITDVLVNPLTM